MENFNENHLALFFTKLIIFLLAFGLFYYIFSEYNPELKSKDSYLSSIISVVSKSDTPEEKTSLADRLFKGKSEQKVTMTTKIIDFENKIIWLNSSQQSVLEVYFIASLITALIYLLFGIGKVNCFVRRIAGSCMLTIAIFCFTIPFFMPVIPIALLPFAIAWGILGIILPITLPIGLLFHLIIGILRLLIRNKVSANM